jgi:hypothetical protein
MLFRTFLVLAILLAAAGCGLEILGTAAVRSGLEVENAKQQAHTMGKVTGPAVTEADSENLEALRQAIAKYGRTYGKYPPDLESLKPSFMLRIPQTAAGTDFTYDPRTGHVWHPEQPPPQIRGRENNSAGPAPNRGLGGAAGAAKQKRDRTYDRMLDELGN